MPPQQDWVKLVILLELIYHRVVTYVAEDYSCKKGNQGSQARLHGCDDNFGKLSTRLKTSHSLLFISLQSKEQGRFKLSAIPWVIAINIPSAANFVLPLRCRPDLTFPRFFGTEMSSFVASVASGH